MQRPTWVEINLSNLAFNFLSIKSLLGEQIKYMAVVKADAYGHGAVKCARCLERAGVDWFAVALPEEGIELRLNGINKPILCLGSFWEGQEEAILEYDITPVIFDLEKAEKLNHLAGRLRKTVKIHVKIDTGMNRVGVRFDRAETFARRLRSFENLEVEGLMTHFAAADSDKSFTMLQIDRFKESIRIFRSFGFSPIYFDMANSPASLGYKEARGNMVRLGGIIYGIWEDILPDWVERPKLKRVMSFHTKISFIKDIPAGEPIGYGLTFRTERPSVIASLPVGYNDGYPRLLSNRGKVILKNFYAPVVGRISMDWTLIDVTDIKGVRLGDEVILIGEKGDLKVSVEDIARICGTISYEITCGISKRVYRVYRDDKG
ncbi:MAG: alanine racemase [Pyrinomonadaceae bacterium]|nr:alanine racemase [Pyrinomonadaceae bacterium]MCX7640396.1 alanine racemase [Pyrinomonadaceae bacterium]MDW8304824.1 alanine racemase [Acidobacteriota bacterium]